MKVGASGYVRRVERELDNSDKTYQDVVYFDACLVINVCDNGDLIVVVEQWFNGHRQVTRRVPATSFTETRS